MINSELTLIHPEEIIATLRANERLRRFTFGYTCDRNVPVKMIEAVPKFCPIFDHNPLCLHKCGEMVREQTRLATSRNGHAIFRCQFGIISFAVPFLLHDSMRCCILGSGIREKSIDLWHIEELAKLENFDPFQLLDLIEQLPEVSMEEVREAAEEVEQFLKTVNQQTIYGALLEKTVLRMNSIAAVSRQIDEAATALEACMITSEAMGVLLDVPAIAVALPDDGPRSFTVTGTWSVGIEETGVNLPAAILDQLLLGHPVPLAQEETLAVFPERRGDHVTALGLVRGERLLAIFFIFNREISGKDLVLIELLAGRTAAALLRLSVEEGHRQQQTMTARTISHISRLALAESRQDLYRELVEAATEVARATSASVMLVNETGDMLDIEHAVGMNLTLARTLTVKTGAGIAGRVAETGTPLLVADIEKDERVASPNRPRFKTKSFMSLPLRIDGDIIGVINLSDREDGRPFTQEDLDLVSALVAHGCDMIKRVGNLEHAATLEQLSVTDHLTGLYNRRFLEKRLREELARCLRQKQSLTVMMIDLDYFKVYNDQCGHLEGDRALKKTASILTASARAMDIVTRYGGEEFCLVLPGTSKREAMFVAERIRRGIENTTFFKEEVLPSGRLTGSVGVASFPEDGDTPHELIEGADIALYNAKAGGRNSVAFFSNGMRQDLAGAAES